MHFILIGDGDCIAANFLRQYLAGGGNIELAQEVTIRAEELQGSLLVLAYT